MAHIIQFSIEGLAGRENVLTQKLDRHTNVFFGPNGSGKTSLLRILDSAMLNDASLLRRVPFKSAKVKIYSNNYKMTFTKSIEKSDTVEPSLETNRRDRSKRTKVEPIFPGMEDLVASPSYKEPLEWKTEPANPQSGSWNHIYLPTWRLYVTGEPYSAVNRSSIQAEIRRDYDWDAYFGQKLEQLWSKYTTRLLINVRRIQEQGLAKILREILATNPRLKHSKGLDSQTAYKRVQLFLKRQGSPNILGTIEKFEKSYTKNAIVQKVVDDINQVEESILAATTSRRELEQLIKEMFLQNKSIEFKDSGIEVLTRDKKKIDLSMLSSGEKHLLWIFIEILLAGNSTLLIDEPEMSLHIDWQTNLISSMNKLNPDPQLILASHSPDIMANLPDKYIFSI